MALLGAAVVAILLFRRLGLDSVLGHLVAGLAIGSFGLGLFDEPQAILHAAELDVLMFLFLFGLQMQPSHLWSFCREIFGLGTGTDGHRHPALLCAAGSDRCHVRLRVEFDRAGDAISGRARRRGLAGRSVARRDLVVRGSVDRAAACDRGLDGRQRRPASGVAEVAAHQHRSGLHRRITGSGAVLERLFLVSIARHGIGAY